MILENPVKQNQYNSMDNNPTVYTTGGAQFKPDKKWYQTWRIIFPILVVVLVLELLYGLKTLLAPLPKSTKQSLQPISGAKISLISPKSSYKVGENVPISIRVFTSGHSTSGTDLVLKFNPKTLDATLADFTKGKIYDDYPQVTIDSQNGIIRASGVSSANKTGFNGIGEFGVVNFKAKSVGESALTIDFQPNLTSESNVVDSETIKDVLEKVYNLKVAIQ